MLLKFPIRRYIKLLVALASRMQFPSCYLDLFLNKILKRNKKPNCSKKSRTFANKQSLLNKKSNLENKLKISIRCQKWTSTFNPRPFRIKPIPKILTLNMLKIYWIFSKNMTINRWSRTWQDTSIAQISKVTKLSPSGSVLILISTRWQRTCVTTATTQKASRKKPPSASIVTDSFTLRDNAKTATSKAITPNESRSSRSAEKNESACRSLRERIPREMQVKISMRKIHRLKDIKWHENKNLYWIQT